MSPTFKQFLQSKTFNAEKNKSYYQQYDVKIMRAFHKQAMMKQKIYEIILARRSEMEYSLEKRFETSLVNVDKAKGLIKSNQPVKSNQKQQIWFRCGSIKY